MVCLEGCCEEAVSSDIESDINEDTSVVGDNISVTGSQDEVWSRPQHVLNCDSVHPFTGIFNGFKTQEAHHVNKTFFSDYHLFSLLHVHDPTIGNRD